MPYILIYLSVINSLAYLLMIVDKVQSKNKGVRIPESYLFMIAILLGALGIYMGMKYPLYHKAAKQKFKIGIPIFILINGICLYLVNNQ